MRTFRSLASSLLLAAAPAAFAQSPPPNEIQTMPRPTPDADALAAAMRRLGANPRDLEALLNSAELSIRLGDVSAAAALFARAEKIDPMNGRVKAGQASILVREERPAEALRYFSQAEGYGYDPRHFASDRGLAYDLIGEQERAQRDYRTALKDSADDETIRRYALSLGISGRLEESLAQIDTLLRKSDRGAWRARAFILAMNGDSAEASRIVRVMMPRIAPGLEPFFTRLPTLAAADRAFAVHFGELRPTAERLADAQFRPELAPLPPEPRAVPVLVAAAPVTKAEKKKKRERKRRGVIEPVELAVAAPRVAPLPPPPEIAAPAPAPPALAPAKVVAAVAPPVSTVEKEPATPPPVAVAVREVAKPPVETGAAAGVAPATPVPPPVPTSDPTAGIVATATPTPAPALPQPTPVASAPPPIVPAPGAMPVPPRMSEDTILARIVAGISIPGSELGIAPPPAPPPPVETVVVKPPTVEAQLAIDLAAEAKKEEARKALAAEAKKLAEAKAVAAKKAVNDTKALAAKKAADDKKAALAKKAAEEKALAAKQAADEKKAAKADAARIWVQVAGGAFEGDLPKAWAAVRAKAPALAGRQGYSTPLRSTNRVATGPFKTNEEAQAFVNQLAKQGVSAFTFTSAAGQKMTKLPAK